VLQRKKPLIRKKALRTKMPLRANGRRDTMESDDAADKVWPLLEARGGPPFTRNERIGPYRADFACPAAKLVILFENGDDPARRDWFSAQDWRVLSFDPAESARDPDRVIDAVAATFTLRIVKR
jgi:very-short-patch-repair endonuclease